MDQVDSEQLSSLSGNGVYSYIANSSNHSKPFHDYVEKQIKSTIGDFRDPYMDAVSGKWHRWKHGHETFEILDKVVKDPFGRGKDMTGHFLTDIFTKDGMPIPGMSKDYLGSGMVSTLEGIGVDRPIKWLNMNGFDYALGGLSISESTHDLSQALNSDTVDLTWEKAFDTYGEGFINFYFGIQTANIVLLASAATEFTAGSIIAYKSISRENTSIYERVLDNLPSQSEMVSALGFFLTILSLKNYISYINGKTSKSNFKKNTIVDLATSLSSFAITKSLIATLSVGAASGGMLLPLLIGGGSSMIFRGVFQSAFPNNRLFISEQDLWEKSPFEYKSPWLNNVIDNSSMWREDVFDNKNIWQKGVFDK
jgi:hypothetical protein